MDEEKKEDRLGIKERSKEGVTKYLESIDELRKSINRLVDTKDGLQFFTYIYKLSGQASNKVPRNKETGEIDAKELIWMKGNSFIYDEIKQYIPTKKRLMIEATVWEKK